MDRQGKEVRSEKASKDENILLLNRFHVISEEKEEEHTRTANPKEEVNKKNYEENEEGNKEGLHRKTTEARWIGAEESGNGKLEGAKLATVPPTNLQIMGDSAQGTLHVNGVHGQPQNHMEVRETHAEKESGNPRNCQNNKNLIKSHQKESEGQYTAVQIQKEGTQQKSTSEKVGPSLQPANRLRPAKASGQELVEVTAQVGKEGALVSTENRPSTQHSKRDPTNINSAGKGKNSNKATVDDGKLTLDTKQVSTSIQDLNTYPLQHPTQAAPAPHGATQSEKETGDQINSDEALEQAMTGQQKNTVNKKDKEKSERGKLVITTTAQKSALWQEKAQHMTEYGSGDQKSSEDTLEGSGEHVPTEEEATSQMQLQTGSDAISASPLFMHEETPQQKAESVGTNHHYKNKFLKPSEQATDIRELSLTVHEEMPQQKNEKAKPLTQAKVMRQEKQQQMLESGTRDQNIAVDTIEGSGEFSPIAGAGESQTQHQAGHIRAASSERLEGNETNPPTSESASVSSLPSRVATLWRYKCILWRDAGGIQILQLQLGKSSVWPQRKQWKWEKMMESLMRIPSL
ncbi:hypothetical protein SCA6_018915 [Theobroma cacao]